MPRVPHKNLVNVTLALSLQSLSVNLINIFVPLLLLDRGVRLWGVCLYYLAYAVCKLAVNYPSVLLIQKFSPRVGLVIALCCSSVYVSSFNLLSTGLPAWSLVATAAAMALTNAFLWNSQHIHLARMLVTGSRGTELAVIESVSRLMVLSAPLVGGVAISVGGQRALLLSAVGLTLLAVVPAWRIQVAGEADPRFDEPVRYGLGQTSKRDLWANFCYNANAVIAMMVWPVYMAEVVSDFADIGVINTVSALAATVLLWVAGRRGDAGKTRRVLAEGTVLVSLTNVLRLFALNPITITAVGTAAQLAGSYQNIPWTSTYYGHAGKEGVQYVMAMEIAGDMAYVFVWMALFGVSLAFSQGHTVFVVAFVLTSLLSLGVLRMRAPESPRPVPEPVSQ